MGDRKILYLLLLTAVVGSVITLCTGFLTGGLERPGQVTVTLAGGSELQDNNRNRAAGPVSDGSEEETGVSAAGAAGVLPAQGEVPSAAGTAEKALPDGNERTQEDTADGTADGTAPADAVWVSDLTEDPADGVENPDDAGDGAAFEVIGAEMPEGSGQAEERTDAVVYAAGSADPQEEGGPAGYAKENPQQVVLSPLETAAGYDGSQEFAAVSVEVSDGGAFSDEDTIYLRRLKELDAQIQKSRETQNTAASAGSSNSLAKNAASNELKLWDSELNAIYNEILKHLDEEQTQELVSAERQWMKNRDADAVEAAKNSAGGSLESVEYTASLASSTRARAYELVSLYGSVLTEQK